MNADAAFSWFSEQALDRSVLFDVTLFCDPDKSIEPVIFGTQTETRTCFAGK